MHRLDTLYNFAKYQVLAINLNSVTNITYLISDPIICLHSLKEIVLVFTKLL